MTKLWHLRVARGFTLIELLLVCTVIALLALLFFPVISGARKRSSLTVCTSNLRQIGMAYQMYVADQGDYPGPHEILNSRYLKDQSILFCPDDGHDVLMGGASSYVFQTVVPPAMHPLAGSNPSEIGSQLALAACEHHTGERTVALSGDRTRNEPATYPYRLVLRADGHVDRVRLDLIRMLPLAGQRMAFVEVYPGEPGYESARSR